jgi:hypothetical protein
MINQPRVFVVQQPAFFDRSATPPRFINKYDLTPAAAHGRLVFILGPGNIFKNRMDQATAQIKKVLESFTESDSILAVGDPVAIAASVMIAAQRTGGKVTLLKWDRLTKVYESFPIIVA